MILNRATFLLFFLVTGHSLIGQETPIDSANFNVARGSIVENINSDKVEYAPSVSADGKTMVFETNKTGRYALFESRREMVNGVNLFLSIVLITMEPQTI